MQRVAFIPLKMNSRRLPRKNLRELDGRPLFHWAVAALLELRDRGVIDDVVIYCSDDLNGLLPDGVTFLRRPASLDGDSVLGNHLCRAFAEQVDADIYINCFATVPFLRTETLARCVEAVSSGAYDSAVPVIPQHFVWYANQPVTYDPTLIPRTQDMRPAYCEVICYTYTRDVVLQNRRLGDRPYLHPVGRIEGIDIDDEEDFRLAQAVVDAGLVTFAESRATAEVALRSEPV